MAVMSMSFDCDASFGVGRRFEIELLSGSNQRSGSSGFNAVDVATVVVAGGVS